MKSEKYKIYCFAKETRGGAGGFLNQIFKIDKKYFKMRVFLYKKDAFSNFNEKASYINKHYIDNNAPSFKKIVLFLKNLINTYILIAKEQPSLLFAIDLYSAAVLLIIKKLFNNRLKIVLFVNIDLIELIKNKPHKIYRSLLLNTSKYLFKTADFIVFVSLGLANKIVNFFNLKNNKTMVINNTIDFDVQTPYQDTDNDLRLFRKDKNIKILSVGRLDWPKDFATLINAFSLANKKIHSLSLYVIGDGKLKQSLSNQISKLHLKKKVFLLGWKNNIYSYLRNTDIFILSTTSDAFPRVLLEALSFGLPIISTNADFGPSEILGDGKYGLLVPVKNPGAMAKATEKLSLNIEERTKYSKLSRRRSKSFKLSMMLKKYKNVFFETIKSNEKTN